MPVLRNPKHEAFAQEIANGRSLREAYKAAGFKPDERNAKRLRDRTDVAQRIDRILTDREARGAATIERAIEKTGITKAWVMEKLRENAERALQAKAVLNEDGQPVGEFTYAGSVANRALELLGKELGMFIDRREQGSPGDFANLADDELDNRLAEKLREKGLSPRQIRAMLDERRAGDQPDA